MILKNKVQTTQPTFTIGSSLLKERQEEPKFKGVNKVMKVTYSLGLRLNINMIKKSIISGQQ
jgi:hypothetical protein